MLANNSKVTRRSFLKGTALGALGAVGAGALSCCQPNQPGSSQVSDLAHTGEPSFMTPPEPIDPADTDEQKTTDVLIIGGGIGGLITATSCLENNLDVIVLEKNEEPRWIGCDFGFVNPSAVLEAGVEPVDPYLATRDFVEKSGHRTCVDVAYRFMTRSGEAADWFTDKCASWGLYPIVMNYRGNCDFYRNYTHVVRYQPEENTPENVYENLKHMLDSMIDELEQAGGAYLRKTTATQLVKDGDRITGAICEASDGSTIYIEGKHVVVLATGDYAGNEEMFNYYSEWTSDDIDWNESTGLGEGHQLGLWAGAQMQSRPHPMMLFYEPHSYHFLRVNKHGKRYVNEDTGYLGGNVSILRQPDHISWVIFDDNWRETIPQSIPYGGGMGWDQDMRTLGREWSVEEEEALLDYDREEGYLVEADTLEELADAMELEGTAKQQLLDTVKRYNSLADNGLDEDFGKRPELLQLSRIVKPPFYALKQLTDLGVSCGGLMTDVDSRILDPDGLPIDNLYGIGLVTGSLFGVDYNEITVPGISLGRNITFGWLLGKYLAQA